MIEPLLWARIGLNAARMPKYEMKKLSKQQDQHQR